MSRVLVPKEDFEQALRSLTDGIWNHANSGPNSEEFVLPEVTLANAHGGLDPAERGPRLDLFETA